MAGMRRYEKIETDWGVAACCWSDAGVCGFILPHDSERALERAAAGYWPDAQLTPRVDASLHRRIIQYFAGKPAEFDVPLDLSGKSVFELRVLKACRKIGYGQTLSYGQLARKVGNPQAARAVGGVMSRNPIPLIIPCHRVLRSDGTLGGFSSHQGVKYKRGMLDLEGAG